MSEKSVSITRQVVDEYTGQPYQLSVTADFIATDDTYLTIDGKTYVIPNAAAREIAEFILAELPGRFKKAANA